MLLPWGVRTTSHQMRPCIHVTPHRVSFVAVVEATVVSAAAKAASLRDKAASFGAKIRRHLMLHLSDIKGMLNFKQNFDILLTMNLNVFI